MQIVESLLEAAYEDTQLLQKNDELGDSLAIARDVDFVFLTADRTKADTVASFVNDNRYGIPYIEEAEDGFRLIVTLHMPTTQNVLCSVSAFMVCLAKLFDVEYDGWGCVIKSAQPHIPMDA
jgi:hypothetical protein